MTEKSSSIEQQKAEKYMLPKIENELEIDLESNRKLFLTDNPDIYIQPDFYSEEHRVIGEIFAHIGKPKKAQDNKIANDVLKMLLYDEKTGIKHTKYLVVCDEEEEKKLNGRSALAESIRTFGINVLRIDLDDKLRRMILDAQSRQCMTNA